MPVRRQMIRGLVRELLAGSAVKEPPVQVDQIARKLGLEIVQTPDEGDLSGFLLRDQRTRRNLIGVNRAHGEARRRFTIAHELGHFMLHPPEPLHIDEVSSYRVRLRSSSSSAGEDPAEIEANAFAAELLMPEEFLKQDLATAAGKVDLSDDAAISELAGKYAVSTTAMTFRLTNLGLLRT